MRCLLFGGGGFIGSAICERLLRDDHTLRVFERPRIAPYRKFTTRERVEWIEGDLLSRHDVSRALEGVDAVIHLASTTLPKNSNDDPVYDVQTNLVASLQILDAMVACGVGKIVFISSGGTVYGQPAYQPIDERHPTDPYVSYGITKLAIEKYVLMFDRLYGIQARVLRVANPFGERQRIETAQGAVGVFLHRALRRLPIEIWGDGSVVRDYVYVGDVANAFALALDYSGPEKVFNISSGHGTSLVGLIDLIEQTLGRPIERHYLPARPYDVPVSVLDNSLALRELGWSPGISLRDGIRITARWIENHLNT